MSARGEAAGLAEGRALQVPPQGGRRAAFRAGYAAGANDVFGGYDGGWDLGQPYIVRLARGHGPVTYRIDSRTRMRRRDLPPLTRHLRQPSVASARR